MEEKRYKAHFNVAFNELVVKHNFHPNNIVNPIHLKTCFPGLSYEQYLALDMKLLEFCDAIYMLNNYKDSPGAKKELAKANELELEVIYEKEKKDGIRN